MSGTTIGEEQFRRSLQEVHQQAVKDSLTASHDLQRRR
jgi:hypothetical protein